MQALGRSHEDSPGDRKLGWSDMDYQRDEREHSLKSSKSDHRIDKLRAKSTTIVFPRLETGL